MSVGASWDLSKLPEPRTGTRPDYPMRGELPCILIYLYYFDTLGKHLCYLPKCSWSREETFSFGCLELSDHLQLPAGPNTKPM